MRWQKTCNEIENRYETVTSRTINGYTYVRYLKCHDDVFCSWSNFSIAMHWESNWTMTARPQALLMKED